MTKERTLWNTEGDRCATAMMKKDARSTKFLGDQLLT